MGGVLCSHLLGEVGGDNLLPSACSECVHARGVCCLLMNVQLLLMLPHLQASKRQAVQVKQGDRLAVVYLICHLVIISQTTGKRVCTLYPR